MLSIHLHTCAFEVLQQVEPCLQLLQQPVNLVLIAQPEATSH